MHVFPDGVRDRVMLARCHSSSRLCMDCCISALDCRVVDANAINRLDVQRVTEKKSPTNFTHKTNTQAHIESQRSLSISRSSKNRIKQFQLSSPTSVAIHHHFSRRQVLPKRFLQLFDASIGQGRAVPAENEIDKSQIGHRL